MKLRSIVLILLHCPLRAAGCPFITLPRQYAVRRRSRRRNLLRQHVLSVTVVLLAVLMLLASHLAGTYAAQETQPVYKYYKEIRVGRGESLWSIAEKYCGDEYGGSKGLYQRSLRS